VCSTAYLMLRTYLNNKLAIHKSKQISQRRSRKTDNNIQQEDVADWVYDLLGEFGLDEDLLYDDEAPEELSALIPIAKGFIKSGGLSKLIPQQAQGQSSQEMEV